MRAVSDPVPERLTRQRVVLLLLDHQVGPLWEPDAAALRRDVARLASEAAKLRVPTIASATSCDAWGPIIPELRCIVPPAAVIPRSVVNAWHVTPVRSAVEVTRRQQLIIAGLATEGCVVSTALAAADSGYRVYVALDASGHFKEAEATTAIARMVHAGVRVTSSGTLLAELLAHDPELAATELLALAHCHRLPSPPAASPLEARFAGDAA
jgi:nicotinamidase-related amidase